MGFWSSLFGGSTEAPAPLPAPRPSAPAAAPAVRVPPRWGEIEIEGESYRRDSIRRLFEELGLPEGGVAQQSARLVPEPTNEYDRFAVKVLIGKWHVGYIPSSISSEVSAALNGRVGVAPIRVWAAPKDGAWRARGTLFPEVDEPDRDFAQEQRDAPVIEPTPETIAPEMVEVTGAVDLRHLECMRMRIKGVGNYVGYKERQAMTGIEWVLVREPGNPHDSSAVMVTTSEGRKVGYVSASRAKMLAPLMDAVAARAYVVSGTGGSDESIQLWVDVPKADAIRAFVKSLPTG
ncbi:HIRAN domain-containing protein [Microbacterium sp. P05]|uniref:HIRAN domain-containing protein n=1 Tax=Microbacterium sp. P05 TaxID=3366948 RepID=UPI0037460CE3